MAFNIKEVNGKSNKRNDVNKNVNKTAKPESKQGKPKDTTRKEGSKGGSTNPPTSHAPSDAHDTSGRKRKRGKRGRGGKGMSQQGGSEDKQQHQVSEKQEKKTGRSGDTSTQPPAPKKVKGDPSRPDHQPVPNSQKLSQPSAAQNKRKNRQKRKKERTKAGGDITTTTTTTPTTTGAEGAKGKNAKAKTGSVSASAPVTEGAKPRLGLLERPGIKLTPLQQKMKQKLQGAQFRWLNEQLYTKSSKEAVKLFKDDPSLFQLYHDGFRHQVQGWPTNPVDVFIDTVKSLPKQWVIADLGCGDAKLAESVSHKVLSYDLVARNERVIAADCANLPLDKDSVNVAIFSLSLMGVNYQDFLREAHRILKVGGHLYIAEVCSRVDDIEAFVQVLETLGFDVTLRDEDNPLFFILHFIKTDRKPKSPPNVALKPCRYKKR